LFYGRDCSSTIDSLFIYYLPLSIDIFFVDISLEAFNAIIMPVGVNINEFIGLHASFLDKFQSGTAGADAYKK
jgi:hypothetical protein